MKRDKEEAFDYYMQVVKESWPYQRLTWRERDRLIIGLSKYRDRLKGDFYQRADQMAAMYSMFLEGVGYEPTGWRETEVEVPF